MACGSARPLGSSVESGAGALDPQAPAHLSRDDVRQDVAERDRQKTLTKIASLLYRHTGVVVPYRTFHRYCVAELGYRPGRATTVRVDDPEPGSEVQIDFGKMGLLFDAATARRRFVYALIFTAAYSRHLFVFLTFSQTLASVIEGCEAAWAFFGGVFKVVIPDNMKAIVEEADPINARFAEVARNTPPAAMIDELKASKEAFVAAARTVPEDRFEEGKTAYRILHTTGIDHYREHMPPIQDWRQREGI